MDVESEKGEGKTERKRGKVEKRWRLRIVATITVE